MEVKMKYKINLQIKQADYEIFKKLQSEYKAEGYGVMVLFSDMIKAFTERSENEKRDNN
jgi:hypothetical protein